MPTKKRPTSLSIAEIRAQADALFESIGDGAIATDEFGKITRINPTALALLGYKESDVMGKWFPKKIIAVAEGNNPINLIDRPITKAFLTGQSISEKTSYRKADGQVIPVAVTVSPILLQGRPVGAIEVFRDITLEYEIDRMKSEFISLASHQLRTPLSAIKTYSHMMIEGYMGDVSTAQKKSLHTIIAATNRMNELISTLLNITRIESGKIAINLKPLNAVTLCEEVLKDLRPLAKDRSISMHLTMPKKPVLFKTDNLITKEILSNLVSNAIKYTPEGGTITVMVRARGRNVVFTVTDTGLGIPKESHDKIFTKFFRAQNVIKQETTGTGLGLYLVKGLLENLGGDIWFESEEQKGTAFSFSLPKYGAATIKS